ncbi:hypothetical protein DICA1_A04786 [Diutina catenulata]
MDEVVTSAIIDDASSVPVSKETASEAPKTSEAAPAAVEKPKRKRLTLQERLAAAAKGKGRGSRSVSREGSPSVDEAKDRDGPGSAGEAKGAKGEKVGKEGEGAVKTVKDAVEAVKDVAGDGAEALIDFGSEAQGETSVERGSEPKHEESTSGKASETGEISAENNETSGEKGTQPANTVENEHEPVDSAPKPVENEPKLENQSEKVVETEQPVETEPKLVETEQEPAHTTEKPVETEPQPAQTTEEPTQTTEKPVETSKKPTESDPKTTQTTKQTAEPSPIPSETQKTTESLATPEPTPEPTPKIARLQRQLITAQSELASLKATHAQELAALKAQVARPSALETKLAQKDQQIAELLREGEVLSKKELKLNESIKRLKQENASLEHTLADYSRKSDDGQRQLVELHDALKLAGLASVDQLLERMRQVEREASEARARADAEAGWAQKHQKLQSVYDQEVAAHRATSAALENLRLDFEMFRQSSESSAASKDAQLRQTEQELARAKQENQGEIARLEAKVEQLRVASEGSEAPRGSATAQEYARLSEAHSALQSQYLAAQENWKLLEVRMKARADAVEGQLENVTKLKNRAVAELKRANVVAAEVESSAQGAAGDAERLRARVKQAEMALAMKQGEVEEAQQRAERMQQVYAHDREDLERRLAVAERAMREAKVERGSERVDRASLGGVDRVSSDGGFGNERSFNERSFNERSFDRSFNERSFNDRPFTIAERIPSLGNIPTLPEGPETRESRSESRERRSGSRSGSRSENRRESRSENRPESRSFGSSDHLRDSRGDSRTELARVSSDRSDFARSDRDLARASSDQNITVSDSRSDLFVPRSRKPSVVSGVSDLGSESDRDTIQRSFDDGPQTGHVHVLSQMAASVRRLEVEMATVREDNAQLQRSNHELSEQYLASLRRVEGAEAHEKELAELRQALERQQAKERTMLEVLGEKTEQVQELEADVVDLKDLLRSQVQQMVEMQEAVAKR